MVKRCLSNLAGWLNILICLFVPACYVYVYVRPFKYEYYVKQIAENLQSVFVQPILLGVSLCFLFWLIPTILLLRGIKQNRRSLMAPWIYLTWLLLIIGFVVFMVYHYNVHAWGYQFILEYSKHLTALWVFFAVCLIPVTMFYNKLNVHHSSLARNY